MVNIDLIKHYFPQQIRDNAIYHKYMLKEYIQLLILDYLSTIPYAGKFTFIGGTNLRLILGIDRFSEDIDFDCKNLSEEEFMKMTDGVLSYMEPHGQSPWYLHEIPSYAKASEGYPQLATSAACLPKSQRLSAEASAPVCRSFSACLPKLQSRYGRWE